MLSNQGSFVFCSFISKHQHLGVGGHLTNVIHEDGAAIFISLEGMGRNVLSAVE
jgi:hypothetical protein